MPTPPDSLRLETIRAVRQDAVHNAFTDLRRFGDSLYLCFRTCPSGHMLYETSRNVVLRSDDDGANWREVLCFGPLHAGYDIRDPHLVIHGDRLWLYVSAWRIPQADAPRDMNDMRSYAASTADGDVWDGPEHLPDLDGHFVWRAAAHDGAAWLCGRRLKDHADVPYGDHPELMESRLLTSRDGRTWQAAGNFQDHDGNETAFIMAADGAVTAVCRRTGPMTAELCESAPPYSHWRRRDLGHFIGGPMLVRWGDELLVGGRDHAPGGSVMQLWWLRDGALVPALTLPSGGDCSYPGFHAYDDQHALISWYSSHHTTTGMHGPAAIYVADLYRS